MADRQRKGFSRRTFLKGTALAGCTALAGSQLELIRGLLARAEAGELTPMEYYELKSATSTVYTACFNCNTGCGLKVKLIDGIAVKIDGNPYSPFNLHPHIPMNVSPSDAVVSDGGLCPKGQSAHQGAYDPYRICKVLKRAGNRGDGNWISIPFDQAVSELLAGGALFKDVEGEEKRKVLGLKALHALQVPTVFRDMAGDVELIRKKQLTVAEFKKKHASALQNLIDANHPDLGPKNNQLVFMLGNMAGGRRDFVRRFTDAFGTVNVHDNPNRGSLQSACRAMTEQYTGESFSGGADLYWQADQEHAEYILFVGSNPFDGGNGPNRGPRMMQRLVSGKLKMGVVDPVFTKTAAKAQRWVPIKPGTDAAFAMGMTRWILEKERYDPVYLANANRAGATKDDEPTWSNATWLVRIDNDGNPGAFLRASELGLKPVVVKTDDGNNAPAEYLVAIRDGEAVAFDPNDTRLRVRGELFVDTTLQGPNGPVRAKSSLQLMLETARQKSLAEYAAICGIEPGVIEAVAKEFTSHGKKACIEVGRGVTEHANGFYTVAAFMNLNLLMGNFDWKGGMITAATFNYDGSSNGSQPYNLRKISPETPQPFGLSIIRHNARYEESTIFAGYPAKRNWWPLATDACADLLPSIAEGYPYPVKVLFSCGAEPVSELPAGDGVIETLTDLERVPLHVACDLTIGSTCMYADYVFPDLHFLERWEFHDSQPNMPVKSLPVRHPVVTSPNDIVRVFGREQHISLETLLLALAEQLELPAFGKGGFGMGLDLMSPEQFYWRLVANAAYDGPEPAGEAGDQGVGVFDRGHERLHPSAVRIGETGNLSILVLTKAMHILNCGGRFAPAEAAYEGDYAANRYGRLVNLYQEKTSQTRDAFTGRPFHGIPRYMPLSDAMDKDTAGLEQGYDLHLVSGKDICMEPGTSGNQYLTTLMPENRLLINPVDAQRLGLVQGQKVKVVSAANPDGQWSMGKGRKSIEGRVHIAETIRPGVISFSLGHGGWADGVTGSFIDGKLIKGDMRRGMGFNANAVMWRDPHLKNTPIMDKIGGSASGLDTKVRLVKV
jgi:tetrathionate reductase subunit A